MFLHTFGHLDRNRMVDKALEMNLFQTSEGVEDIYNSLMRFKEYHGIKIVPQIEKLEEEIAEPEKPTVVFLQGKVKVSQRSNKLVQAIKEEIANLQQQQKMLENILAVYEKEAPKKH